MNNGESRAEEHDKAPRQAPDADLADERTVPGVSEPGNVMLQESRYRFAATQLHGGLLLDLGCGIGNGSKILGGTGARVVGLDYDLEAVRRAAAWSGQQAAGFTAADARRLPFADKVFDGVVCFEILEHVREQAALLKEIHRVLKPGGRLLLSTPNRHTEKRLDQPGEPGISRFHVATPGPRELRKLLAGHFRLVALLGYRRRGSRLYALVRSLDFFNLRLLVRGVVRQRVARVVGAPTAAPPSDQAEFVLDRRGLRQALVLVAVCERPPDDQ